MTTTEGAGWTAPAVQRRPEPEILDERAGLEGWLDYHRDTLLMKCAGLTVEQLRERAVPPSSLSLLGLVRHMAEVERSWFRRRLAGQDLGYLYCSDDNEDGDFDDVDTADAEADFATYRSEVELARAAAAELPLDQQFVRPNRPTLDLRWIYLHMIEEYARHNGHADLLRERIDGVTGD
ncbi:MAG: DinB family protein [Actinomycetales bacterium]